MRDRDVLRPVQLRRMDTALQSCGTAYIARARSEHQPGEPATAATHKVHILNKMKHMLL